MTITNIQDARALKRMGVAPNMPVEHFVFSETYSKHWFGLMKAHDTFCGALADYVDDVSFPKWRKPRKGLNGIFRAMGRSDAAIADPNEQTIMASFLLQRAVPFAEYWEDALDAVEGGAALTIAPADWPRWSEED
jgi:hypothetical protein